MWTIIINVLVIVVLVVATGLMLATHITSLHRGSADDRRSVEHLENELRREKHYREYYEKESNDAVSRLHALGGKTARDEEMEQSIERFRLSMESNMVRTNTAMADVFRQLLAYNPPGLSEHMIEVNNRVCDKIKELEEAEEPNDDELQAWHEALLQCEHILAGGIPALPEGGSSDEH